MSEQYISIRESYYQARLTLEIARLLQTRNPDALKAASPDAYKHYERMHELYRQLDDMGYEETPTELYEQWLSHIKDRKESEAPASTISGLTGDEGFALSIKTYLKTYKLPVPSFNIYHVLTKSYKPFGR